MAHKNLRDWDKGHGKKKKQVYDNHYFCNIKAHDPENHLYAQTLYAVIGSWNQCLTGEQC